MSDPDVRPGQVWADHASSPVAATPGQLATLRRFKPSTGDGLIGLECQACYERSGRTSDLAALVVMALGHICPAPCARCGRPQIHFHRCPTPSTATGDPR